jgi:hypothetical protein
MRPIPFDPQCQLSFIRVLASLYLPLLSSDHGRKFTMVTREDDTCKPQSVMPMTKNSDADDRQKPGTQLHIRVMSLKTEFRTRE